MNLSILGLNKYEEAVYEAIIKHGKSSASIICKTSRVPYGRIYDVLSSLEEKGFVKVIPEPTKHFIATDPSNLKEILENKKKELNQIEKDINNMKKIYDEKTEDIVITAQGKSNFIKLIKEMPKGNTFDYAIKYTAEYRPDWVESVKSDLKKLQFKVLTRYDIETKKAVNKWVKLFPHFKKIENEGVAISLNDNAILIGLIKSNTTLLIKDKAFVKLMKDLFESKYEKANSIEK